MFGGISRPLPRVCREGFGTIDETIDKIKGSTMRKATEMLERIFAQLVEVIHSVGGVWETTT